MKKQRNIRKKSDENLQKRRFPAYFRHFRPEKNFSQKSDSAIFRSLLIHIFEQKIRKNWWWNIEKMPKNRFFRHISRNFGRKNMLFENRARSHVRHCNFASVCKISWKKYKVQLKKFKKYRFSGENRLFRRFLESSGYKNQLNWQMNHA